VRLPSPSALVARVRANAFFAGMLGAIVLASAAPSVGRSGGLLHGELLADAGIFLVFLLHGASLSGAAVREGMSRWRLHVVVQLFTFAVFPIVWLALAATFGRWLPAPLRFGFAFLAALPSTISSSVAMTAIARGNVPGAIFNAVLSNVLGVVVTPVLVGAASAHAGSGPPLGRAILGIAALVLLPLVAGQALRPIAGVWLARHRGRTSSIDKCVIVLIVYVAFCDSAAAGIWSGHGPRLVVLAIASALALLAIVLALTTVVAGWLGFEKEDEIAAVFCGSKKALSSGVAMAKVLFGAHAGVTVLPVICYHQLQLFVCSALAERYARRSPGAAGDGN
jgi:sodium/bile acid cotransporter 7